MILSYEWNGWRRWRKDPGEGQDLLALGAANVRGWILWNEYVERKPEGLPILPLLRAVPKLGGRALGYNAPDPRGWRQTVR